MKQMLFIIVMTAVGLKIYAQEKFISSGRIEFEKRENIHKTIDMYSQDWDEQGGSFLDEMKKHNPQFAVYYYDLFFNENKTLYKPGRETQNQKVDPWVESPAKEVTIFNDLQKHMLTSQKTVFGSVFLIKDSSRTVEWRITNETREIAGFDCRKAVGKIMDSVYVIAFYTDQILTTGGPESFNGLPGMILGVAIPRINTTWFATKLELIPVTDASLPIPTKGKIQNSAAYKKSLQETLKDWKSAGKRMTIEALI